jgi:hypothetical protein
LSSKEKENYFNECIKKTNTLDYHFDHDKDTYELFLSTEIVEVIISDLFFRNDEQLKDIVDDDNKQNPADEACKKLVKKHNEKKNVMKLFCKKHNAYVYTVTIKDYLRFTWPWTMLALAYRFGRWWQPSKKPRIARRRRNSLASMTASSASTRAS